MFILVAYGNPCWGAAPSASSGNVKIIEALRAPARLAFIQTPLADVVAFLGDQHKINIEFDHRALAEIGIKPNVLVTRELKGVSLHSALALILDQLDLTYVISHGVLLITSPAESKRLVRQGAVIPDEAQVILGNQAVVEALGGSTQFEFIETPLADVVAYFREIHKINIEFDYRALAEVGIKPDVPVTRSLKDVTLHDALQLILSQLGLAHVVQHGILLITSERKGRRLRPEGPLAPGADKPAKPSAASKPIADVIEKPSNPSTAPKKGPAEERTWTDVQGRKITAQFVRADGDAVVLLKHEKEVTVPLARLSPGDRAYVRSQTEK